MAPIPPRAQLHRDRFEAPARTLLLKKANQMKFHQKSTF